jgi:hypothetical protein
MARKKKNKRRILRGAALLALGGGAIAAAKAKLGGDQTPSETPRPAPVPSETPVRSAEATGEGTGSETVDEGTFTQKVPDDAVKPDTSADDPLVKEQTEKAAAEAGSIGGNVQQMAADEPGFPSDPEMRPVEEGSGDDPEAAEQRDADLGGNRETLP